MVDSRLPRFSQGIQAVLLAVAFLVEWTWVVPILGVILLMAALGGPRWNPFKYLYEALPIPPGELEAAAPPRFAQRIGATFLVIATVGLYSATTETTLWYALGWGPALAVAVLSALAATTSFCLGCEIYLLLQRARSKAA